MDVTAVVLALIAVAGTIYTNRDKWRFDARMLALEADAKRIPALEAKIAALETANAACKAENVQLETTNIRQQGEIDTLRAEVARLKRDLAAQGVRADSTETEKPTR